jgi:hypothetical protein
MRLDASTVMLQWSAGGLGFLWVTTRRREVGIGYGWLLRPVFAVLAFAAAGLLVWRDGEGAARAVAAAAAAGVGVAALAALAASIRRRRIDTFDPRWDLAGPIAGVAGIAGAATFAGGNDALATARLLVGAAFLGCITDAMLLGHWYLVQPGLSRDALGELVRWNLWLWPLEVAALLVPTGMASVFSGAVDDGYNGLLGYVWVACAITTLALVVVTGAALRERYYSAVMSATGLLYLAILTAFGTDLVARATLS